MRDPDTTPEELIFTLLKSPRYGDVVMLNEDGEGERTMREGDKFTYDNVSLINNNTSDGVI